MAMGMYIGSWAARCILGGSVAYWDFLAALDEIRWADERGFCPFNFFACQQQTPEPTVGVGPGGREERKVLSVAAEPSSGAKVVVVRDGESRDH